MKQFWLAQVCRICPFCVCARLWKNSRFAKMLREAEKNCPACRAYNQMYGKKGN